MRLAVHSADATNVHSAHAEMCVLKAPQEHLIVLAVRPVIALSTRNPVKSLPALPCIVNMVSKLMREVALNVHAMNVALIHA
jgi:hypothetical protein